MFKFHLWKEKARKVKRYLFTLYLAYKNPRTSWHSKLLIFLILAYALSPIDLIPDFIPVIGYLDDLIILPAMILFAVKTIPKDVWEECYEKTEDIEINKKFKITGMVIIISLWAVILFVIIKSIVTVIK